MYPARPRSSRIEQDTTSFALGTNQVDQDVLSRLIWGARIDIIIGFSAATASFLIGVPLGLIAGFAGGKLDRIMTLIMDSIYAFPSLILAIAITAVLGPSIFNIIVAIAVLSIPAYYRIVRGQTLSTREELLIEAVRSLAAKSRVILGRHIFPNVILSVAVIFSVNAADAILTGAELSVLGLGLPLDVPDWGIDLARGQEYIVSAQALLLQLMIKLKNEFDLTYLFITHDLATTKYICDRIGIMYLGKIVEIGPLKDVFENPQHPYTKALLSAVPVPDPRHRRTDPLPTGEIPNPIDPPGGCNFHPRCAIATMGVCDGENPTLLPVAGAPEHMVSCHLRTGEFQHLDPMRGKSAVE